METRVEHLEWCKQRALEYVEINDLPQAFASFQSDITKHSETINHSGIELGTMLMITGHLSTPQQMKDWIIGFN